MIIQDCRGASNSGQLALYCKDSVVATVDSYKPFLSDEQNAIVNRFLTRAKNTFNDLSRVTFADSAEIQKVAVASSLCAMAVYKFNRDKELAHELNNDAIANLSSLVSSQNKVLNDNLKSQEGSIADSLSKFAAESYNANNSMNSITMELQPIFKRISTLQGQIGSIMAKIKAKETAKAALKMVFSIFSFFASIFSGNVAGAIGAVSGACSSGADLADINAGEYDPIPVSVNPKLILDVFNTLTAKIDGVDLTPKSITFKDHFNGLEWRDKFEHLKYTSDGVFKQVRALQTQKLDFDDNEELKHDVSHLHECGNRILGLFESLVDQKIAFASALFTAYDMQTQKEKLQSVAKLNDQFAGDMIKSNKGALDIKTMDLTKTLEASREYLYVMVKQFWSAVEYQEVERIPFEASPDSSILDLASSLDALLGYTEGLKDSATYSAYDSLYTRSIVLCEDKEKETICDIEDKGFFQALKSTGQAVWTYNLNATETRYRRERLQQITFTMGKEGLLLPSADEPISVWAESNDLEVYLPLQGTGMLSLWMDNVTSETQVNAVQYKIYGNERRNRVILDADEPHWNQMLCQKGVSICPSPYKSWTVRVKDLESIQGIGSFAFHMRLSGRKVKTSVLAYRFLDRPEISAEYYGVTVMAPKEEMFLLAALVTAGIYVLIAVVTVCVFWLHRHLTFKKN